VGNEQVPGAAGAEPPPYRYLPLRFPVLPFTSNYLASSALLSLKLYQKPLLKSFINAIKSRFFVILP